MDGETFHASIPRRSKGALSPVAATNSLASTAAVWPDVKMELDEPCLLQPDGQATQLQQTVSRSGWQMTLVNSDGDELHTVFGCRDAVRPDEIIGFLAENTRRALEKGVGFTLSFNKVT